MIFYFTSSDLFGAKLIKWGLNSDISHFAWGTRNDPYSIVVQSDMKNGVHPSWQSEFLKAHEVIVALQREETPEVTNALYKTVVDKIGGQAYDSGGFIYWSLAVLGEKLGMKAPTKNQWASKDEEYCSEVARVMRPYFMAIGLDCDILDSEFLSPPDICVWLQASGKFEDISNAFRR